MKKRKFSKTGLILVGSMILCVVLFLAIGVPNGFFSDSGSGGNIDDENTPGIKEVIEDGTPILIFDKSEGAKALMTAFDEGKIASADVLYDEMGGNPSYETSDQGEIKEIYKAMKNIVIVKETNTSMTDCYHHVYFTLEDGTKYGYSFEGREILNYGDKNYEISGGGDLWNLLRGWCCQQ